MAISIFNVHNHLINGEMLRKINSFSTDEYAGIVGTSVPGGAFTLNSNNKVKINVSTPLIVIGGGCVLSVPATEITGRTVSANSYYYIDVNTSSAFETDNMLTDASTYAAIGSTTYQSAEIDWYKEHGQTIWNGNTFRIPLFARNSSGVFESLIFMRDKSSLEAWLSAEAYQSLQDWALSTFTQLGGSTADNNFFGRIGNYDFQGDVISHISSNVKFPVVEAQSESHTFALPAYDAGALYVEDSTNHEMKSGVLPVACGGTGANSRGEVLKNNLGIYWGTDMPADYCTKNGIKPVRGDIYFKVLV